VIIASSGQCRGGVLFVIRPRPFPSIYFAVPCLLITQSSDAMCQNFPSCGAPPQGGQVVCTREIFILNEVCAQDNIYFGRHFALLKYEACLFYNLNFTKMCINLEKYVIRWLNFMSNLFI
jgi:hypothetical protein